MEECAKNKVEEMGLYIEEQEQQLNEVASTWGSVTTFSTLATVGSCGSSAASAATSSSIV